MLKNRIIDLLPDDIYLLDIVEDLSSDRLKIVIDSSKPIKISTTTKIAKLIRNSFLLDEYYSDGIRLEVTSPSIYDPLIKPFQYKKNIGRKISIKKISENKTFLFNINKVDSIGFHGLSDKNEVYIPFKDIESAKIIVDI